VSAFNNNLTVLIPYFYEGLAARDAISDAAKDERVEKIIFISDCGAHDSDFDFLCLEGFNALGNRFLPMCCISNFGPSICRNIGLELIGESTFVAFLDSDDRWESQHLIRSFEFLSANPSCAIIAKQKRLFFATAGLRRIRFLELCCWNPVVLSSVIVVRDRLPCRGAKFRFPEKQNYGEDYLVWLQTSLSSDLFVEFGSSDVYPNPILIGRRSLSSNNWKIFLGCLKNAMKIRKERCGLGTILLLFSSVFRLLVKVSSRILLSCSKG
jgi:glycosyltransferase involved in cell wall biosynthesis